MFKLISSSGGIECHTTRKILRLDSTLKLVTNSTAKDDEIQIIGVKKDMLVEIKCFLQFAELRCRHCRLICTSNQKESKFLRVFFGEKIDIIFQQEKANLSFEICEILTPEESLYFDESLVPDHKILHDLFHSIFPVGTPNRFQRCLATIIMMIEKGQVQCSATDAALALTSWIDRQENQYLQKIKYLQQQTSLSQLSNDQNLSKSPSQSQNEQIQVIPAKPGNHKSASQLSTTTFQLEISPAKSLLTRVGSDQFTNFTSTSRVEGSLVNANCINDRNDIVNNINNQNHKKQGEIGVAVPSTATKTKEIISNREHGGDQKKNLKVQQQQLPSQAQENEAKKKNTGASDNVHKGKHDISLILEGQSRGNVSDPKQKIPVQYSVSETKPNTNSTFKNSSAILHQKGEHLTSSSTSKDETDEDWPPSKRVKLLPKLPQSLLCRPQMLSTTDDVISTNNNKSTKAESNTHSKQAPKEKTTSGNSENSLTRTEKSKKAKSAAEGSNPATTTVSSAIVDKQKNQIFAVDEVIDVDDLLFGAPSQSDCVIEEINTKSGVNSKEIDQSIVDASTTNRNLKTLPNVTSKREKQKKKNKEQTLGPQITQDQKDHPYTKFSEIPENPKFPFSTSKGPKDNIETPRIPSSSDDSKKEKNDILSLDIENDIDGSGEALISHLNRKCNSRSAHPSSVDHSRQSSSSSSISTSKSSVSDTNSNSSADESSITSIVSDTITGDADKDVVMEGVEDQKIIDADRLSDNNSSNHSVTLQTLLNTPPRPANPSSPASTANQTPDLNALVSPITRQTHVSSVVEIANSPPSASKPSSENNFELLPSPSHNVDDVVRNSFLPPTSESSSPSSSSASQEETQHRKILAPPLPPSLHLSPPQSPFNNKNKINAAVGNTPTKTTNLPRSDPVFSEANDNCSAPVVMEAQHSKTIISTHTAENKNASDIPGKIVHPSTISSVIHQSGNLDNQQQQQQHVMNDAKGLETPIPQSVVSCDDEKTTTQNEETKEFSTKKNQSDLKSSTTSLTSNTTIETDNLSHNHPSTNPQLPTKDTRTTTPSFSLIASPLRESLPALEAVVAFLTAVSSIRCLAPLHPTMYSPETANISPKATSDTVHAYLASRGHAAASLSHTFLRILVPQNQQLSPESVSQNCFAHVRTLRTLLLGLVEPNATTSIHLPPSLFTLLSNSAALFINQLPNFPATFLHRSLRSMTPAPPYALSFESLTFLADLVPHLSPPQSLTERLECLPPETSFCHPKAFSSDSDRATLGARLMGLWIRILIAMADASLHIMKIQRMIYQSSKELENQSTTTLGNQMQNLLTAPDAQLLCSLCPEAFINSVTSLHGVSCASLSSAALAGFCSIPLVPEVSLSTAANFLPQLRIVHDSTSKNSDEANTALASINYLLKNFQAFHEVVRDPILNPVGGLTNTHAPDVLIARVLNGMLANPFEALGVSLETVANLRPVDVTKAFNAAVKYVHPDRFSRLTYHPRAPNVRALFTARGQTEIPSDTAELAREIEKFAATAFVYLQDIKLFASALAHYQRTVGGLLVSSRLNVSPRIIPVSALPWGRLPLPPWVSSGTGDMAANSSSMNRYVSPFLSDVNEYLKLSKHRETQLYQGASTQILVGGITSLSSLGVTFAEYPNVRTVMHQLHSIPNQNSLLVPPFSQAFNKNIPTTASNISSSHVSSLNSRQPTVPTSNNHYQSKFAPNVNVSSSCQSIINATSNLRGPPKPVTIATTATNARIDNSSNPHLHPSNPVSSPPLNHPSSSPSNLPHRFSPPHSSFAPLRSSNPPPPPPMQKQPQIATHAKAAVSAFLLAANGRGTPGSPPIPSSQQAPVPPPAQPLATPQASPVSVPIPAPANSTETTPVSPWLSISLADRRAAPAIRLTNLEMSSLRLTCHASIPPPPPPALLPNYELDHCYIFVTRPFANPPPMPEVCTTETLAGFKGCVSHALVVSPSEQMAMMTSQRSKEIDVSIPLICASPECRHAQVISLITFKSKLESGQERGHVQMYSIVIDVQTELFTSALTMNPADPNFNIPHDFIVDVGKMAISPAGLVALGHLLKQSLSCRALPPDTSILNSWLAKGDSCLKKLNEMTVAKMKKNSQPHNNQIEVLNPKNSFVVDAVQQIAVLITLISKHPLISAVPKLYKFLS